MGDTDENVEEWIRSVGEEIRGVEQRIRGVEEQTHGVEEEIRKLEQKIERVEEQIKTCSNLKEKAQLRDEKAQLRSKEDRLRDEIAQLRGKEAQLREQALQGGDRCIEFDWLRQDLPSWDSGNLSTTPSATQKERMYTPLRVEHWDVEKDVEDHLNEADRLRRIFRKMDSPVFTTGWRALVAIAHSVLSSTCEFVGKKQPGSSITFDVEVSLQMPPEFSEGGKSTNPDGSKAEDKAVQKCLFYDRPPRVDVLIQSNGKGVVAFELKNRGLGCPVPIYKLWARCSCRTGFKWDDRQPPLSAAIAYLVSSAVGARGKFDVSPRKGERPWSWEVVPCTSPSGSSKDDEGEGSTYEPDERKTGGYKTSPARTRGAGLEEIPASHLHLDRPISNEGWSGYVVGGTLKGRRVAVKLVLRDSERAEALLNEVDAYRKLREYWGVFVPSLVGYGTTAHGQIVFIATELINGSQLGPVTKEVAAAALQALGAVHACNLLHGDVEARNIMVVRGTQPAFRLVDFGFSRRSRNRKWHEAKLWTLQRLLQGMMGVGAGKESGATYPYKQLCSV